MNAKQAMDDRAHWKCQWREVAKRYREVGEPMNTKQATFKMLGDMETGATFRGIELADYANSVTGKIHYTATMLRYLREYRAVSGRYIECINKPKSTYQIVGGR